MLNFLIFIKFIKFLIFVIFFITMNNKKYNLKLIINYTYGNKLYYICIIFLNILLFY